MEIVVVEKQQISLRGLLGDDAAFQIGAYIDVSNFRTVWVCVGYRDLAVTGSPACNIKVYPAWARGREAETLIDTTNTLSTADLGTASAGSGLVIDDSPTSLSGAVRAPGVVVMLEFDPASSSTPSDTLYAEIGVSLIAST